MQKRFLAVIPAYNEAATIEELVLRASRHADVCVVGGACAGLTAAVCAAENGAKKVLLTVPPKDKGGEIKVVGPSVEHQGLLCLGPGARLDLLVEDADSGPAPPSRTTPPPS